MSTFHVADSYVCGKFGGFQKRLVKEESGRRANLLHPPLSCRRRLLMMQRLACPGGSARHRRCVPVILADWNGGVPSDGVGGAAQSVFRGVCSRPFQSNFEGPCSGAHGGRGLRIPAVSGLHGVACGVPGRLFTSTGAWCCAPVFFPRRIWKEADCILSPRNDRRRLLRRCLSSSQPQIRHPSPPIPACPICSSQMNLAMSLTLEMRHGATSRTTTVRTRCSRPTTHQP